MQVPKLLHLNPFLVSNFSSRTSIAMVEVVQVPIFRCDNDERIFQCFLLFRSLCSSIVSNYLRTKQGNSESSNQFQGISGKNVGSSAITLGRNAN